MATKIKRCLYVGLGGTGMNALLHTKKTFMDTYGEVPPMIGFLGIDTDSGAYKKSLTTVRGEEVTLSPNEQLPILVKDARPIYDVNKEDFSWIPEKNLYALTGMTLGAGQVRTNGRFAFTVNYVQVAQKVRTILDQISNARIQANDKYELLSTNTEIHMVFSVCGGTGCGTFLNMAYLLRKEAPQCKLTGYAVLPDIFKSMSRSGMAKVAPNAYGAILDLDYLMHMGLGSTPVQLDYIKDSYDHILYSTYFAEVTEYFTVEGQDQRDILNLLYVTFTAMKRDRQSLMIKKNTVESQYNKYMGRVSSAPKQERVLTEIGRQREIKQAVFLLMLQKREETAMELANITDKGKLIDPPAPEPGSNKPQKKMVLLVALFLGALLPVGILFLLQMFKGKIDTRQELESATKLPILAELTSTTVEEAIRTLRTNLLLNLKKGQKVLLVVSANKGDGKSSIAKRLEDSLNTIGKRALLINGDLRNAASSVKAHPSDILAGEAFAKEVEAAKAANDFVILDSPALGEYNDALQLASYADATLYIVKAGKTQKADVEALHSNNNIPNPFIVFNK